MDMNQIYNKLQDTTQSHSIRPRGVTGETGLFTIRETTLRRITGLIELGSLILNSLIGLRFMLKLMAANPDNPFASLVYHLAAPFLAIFVGLTQTPSFEGIVIEFYDLIAILVYAVLAWILARLLWILFARLKPSRS